MSKEEKSIEEMNQEEVKSYFEKIKTIFFALAEPLKRVVRSARGEAPEDIPYDGLIEVHDDRQTARLTINEIEANIFEELLWKYGTQEDINCKILLDDAKYTNVYSKSKDGKQWDYLVALKQAKTNIQVAPIGVPSVQTMQQQQQQKSHWYSKNKSQEEQTQQST